MRPTIAQPDDLSGQPGHLVDCLLEGEQLGVADAPAQDAGERAVGAWMDAGIVAGHAQLVGANRRVFIRERLRTSAGSMRKPIMTVPPRSRMSMSATRSSGS